MSSGRFVALTPPDVSVHPRAVRTSVVRREARAAGETVERCRQRMVALLRKLSRERRVRESAARAVVGFFLRLRRARRRQRKQVPHQQHQQQGEEREEEGAAEHQSSN